MKDKILSALKTKFNGVQGDLLDRVAKKLSKTVTEESEIETAVNGVEFSHLLELEGDRRATEAAETHEKKLKEKFDFVEKGKQQSGGEKKKEEPEDKTSKEIDEIKKKLGDYEARERQEKLMSKLKSELSEKKIPESFIKGRTLESEDQIEGVLSEIEADYTSVKQHLINEGVVAEKPKDSFGKSDNIETDIVNWAKEGKPENK